MTEGINLELYLNHLRHGLVIAGPDGAISFRNAVFNALFGRELSGDGGANVFQVFKKNPTVLNSIHRVVEIRGSYYLRDVPIFFASNSHRSMDVETFPLVGTDGELLGISVLLRDRAGLIRFEEHQKRADRIHYVGMIASGLAHEIKNPLSGIKGASQLLVDELKKKELKEYAEIILKESTRVDRLMKDLLNFTKPKKLNKKKVNINQILHDLIVLQTTVAKGSVEFAADFDPSIPRIVGDAEALTQVFLNLIKNARQAVREKGRVMVRSRVVTDFGFRKKDRRRQLIGIDVEDTGEGISEENLPNIFVPFFTTKPRGTGLGLPLCHRIVEEHEGDIEVKSEKGKGTVFSVYLPV
ncbi:MAG: PAS domain-containing sensor histidine kinase [Deltaproteobacteria bacterium]|nr:PAS domain-containing sensor histidine kinase [Deltaproteobacteria bacterium]